MGSRVRSPLSPGDHQLLPRLERERDDPASHYRNGLALVRLKRRLKRTPLKRASKGLKAEQAKYDASAEAFFSEPGNNVCHICLRLREDGDDILIRKATERHHLRGRIGRLLNWRPGQLPSCRGHRSWPHDHPTRARKLGLLCEAKDWNVFPD